MGCLSGLFGKSREGYYSVSRSVREERAVCEREIVRAVEDIRRQDPGIGAYKLHLMIKEVFPDAAPGRDRFYRLMHEKHLMLKPQRRRHTTNSNHNYRKYKNMLKGFKPTTMNRLWVADITYIDTDDGVLYLHLLTDAFTHEVIGWTLSDSLMAEHTIAALQMGIDNMGRYGLKGLIHHSDRGSQYCCNAYIGLLNSIQATISMTEDYCPTDNAIAERVNGIIKQEWLYRMKRPKDRREAHELISGIISFYNNKRPHLNNEGKVPPTRLRNMLTGV